MRTHKLILTAGKVMVIAALGILAALSAAGPASAQMTGDGMECSAGANDYEGPQDCNTSGRT